MKRFGNLWPGLVSFDNLLLAWRKAGRGKRRRDEVARFGVELERELFSLQEELVEGSYLPGAYRQFWIYERKPRLISAAPFRDRVVHHAVMNLIEPLLDSRFIYDCYACRKDKGVHRAVRRYQVWSKRYVYTLKMDVSQYFPSIDHQILKSQLQRHIKDKKMLCLLDKIIDFAPQPGSGISVYFPGDDLFTPLERCKSLPIGNLTSQFFANLYLNQLDHFIKEQLKVKAYLRYVDDLFLLANSKAQLWEWKEQIKGHLTRLRLRAHPRKINIFKSRLGVDVLGYRIFPCYALLRNDNGHRFARRLQVYARRYASGEANWDDFNPSVQSWIGHAGQADTHGLRKAILSGVYFTREQGEVIPA